MAKAVKHTPEDIQKVLAYNPATGEFTWTVDLNSRARAGHRAGVWQRMQNGKDYFSVTYEGEKLSGARLAWVLHYGEWPDRSVFYIDGDSTNLRISNLKLADHRSNRVVGADGKTRYKMTTEAVRHYGLKRNYGISYAEYAQMHASQNGVCAICGNPETATIPGRKTDRSDGTPRELSLDHDHQTGALRGLLCNACNHILGEAKDNPAVLRAAAEYLEHHAAKADSLDPKEGLMQSSTQARALQGEG